jgi:DNA topoisomerase-1
VAGSAQAEAREYIREQFGADYVPARPPQYKTRAKAAQEAHEAIRPTAVRRTPESLQRYLSKDELRLYTLIWRRFVASQMAAAILDQTTVDILAGQPDREKPYLFRATGTVVKFPGFLEVYQERREAGEAAGDERGAGASGGGEESDGEGEGVRLPPLEKGEILDLIRLLPKQHFTQPPPRYTEASLIRALEEYGIGRPSTYAPILTTLVQRAYVERVDKKLAPTQLGFVINDLLVASFPEVINVTYTAEMEEQLDLIANGDRGWVATLQALYAPFAAAVEVAREEMPQVELKPQPTGEQCPQCGSPLVFRQGRNGRFVGCSGWPTCRYTASIPVPGAACPKCGGPILERRARGGRRFYGCANYPACDWAGSRPPKPQAHPEGTLAGQNQEA